MDLETGFCSESDYNEFANEILFVGDILQQIPFKQVMTAVEIRTKKS